VLRSAKLHSDTLRDLALLPNQDLAITASWDRTTHLIRPDLSIVRTFSGHSAYIISIAVSGDEETLVSGTNTSICPSFDLALTVRCTRVVQR
jgi:WD40 repeat protein